MLLHVVRTPDDLHIHHHRCDKLKSLIIFLLFLSNEECNRKLHNDRLSYLYRYCQYCYDRKW
jgi:hypothetical protein